MNRAVSRARRDGASRSPSTVLDKRKAATKPSLEEVTTPILEESASSHILSGDDIQALAVLREDLAKTHPPRPPPASERPSTVMRVTVRRPTRQRQQQEEAAGKTRLLVVRPAPPEAAASLLEYTGPGGPRFDEKGQVLLHSILGSVEDYVTEAVERGETEVAQLIGAQRQDGDQWPPSSEAPTRVKRRGPGGAAEPPPAAPTGLDQGRALQHWQRRMAERRRLQGHIAKVMDTSEERLVMCQSGRHRHVQEERELIDRAIPQLDYGKGFHVGSEFWQLPQRLGDELGGISFTLTQTERGQPWSVTHVGKPVSTQRETGCGGGGGGSLAQERFHKTWERSEYLQQRKQQLWDVLRELDFNQPDIDGLEVLGTSQPFSSTSAEKFPTHEEILEAQTEEERENDDPLRSYPDVVPLPIIGPSIRFCGQPARWTGAEPIHEDELGIAARITFEALAGEKATSYLEVVNDGTTAIYYEWERLVQPGSFPNGHARAHVQRFYFDVTGGVALPGATLLAPFTFKSPSAGIFGERWRLRTRPLLLSGAALQLTLRGVALHEDRTAARRDSIEMLRDAERHSQDALSTVKRGLRRREAVAAARGLLQEVLDGVRTPPRAPSPTGARLSDGDRFSLSNPQLHYHFEVVESLKQLYAEHAAPAGHGVTPQWDFCLRSCRAVLLSIADADRREAALAEFNRDAVQLSAAPLTAHYRHMHSIGYQLLSQMVDAMVGTSMLLRHSMSLPDREGGFSPDDDTGKKGGVRVGKGEDRKSHTGREEKKSTAGRDDRKMDRPGSKKVKIKEDKKSSRTSGAARDGKEAPSLADGEAVSPTSTLADRATQNKYELQLYMQVYALLSATVEEMAGLFEELDENTNAEPLSAWKPAAQQATVSPRR
ncbi:unnamed protein product [Lampetra fluviatilis]